MNDLLLVLSSFLASAVEMVEALTIVLAAGLTRGWRSSLTGVGAAALALAVVVAALGVVVLRGRGRVPFVAAVGIALMDVVLLVVTL